MPYLVKTPLFSYLIKYLNDKFGFRESKINSINKSAAKKIEEYAKTGEELDFIQELKNKNIDVDGYIIKGSFNDIYPLHVQIELTDNCNLHCDYCYRNSNYNNSKSKYIDFSTIENFLLKQKEKSLLEVGVTGGEPTMHPQFLDIMKLVLRNFELSELVTNGTNYNSIMRLIDDVGKDKRKLNLSVSFNRWMRDFNEFKKGNHYLNSFLKHVADKHPIRIILTDILYDSKKSEEVKKILREKGVKEIDFSFVSPIGRGKNKISELEYISRFQNNSETKEGFRFNPFNCGLIFKHTVIGPDENLRPCALFPTGYKIGSIKENFIEEENKILWTIPSPNRDICGSCNLFDYCKGCIYKGLFNSNKNCNYKKFIRNNPNLEFLSHIN